MDNKFIKTKKTYDRFYLNENRKEKPKEYFKFINKFLACVIGPVTNPKILDVGCATGDFLYYMGKLYPRAVLYGVDAMPELIKRAKTEVPSAKFFVADIFSGKSLPSQKFDFVFMSGVHPDFDEYEPWIKNLLKLSKRGGKLFVFGLFNRYPVDTMTRLRPSGSNLPWQPGWNLFSKKTIGDYLSSKKIKFEFHDFDIKIDLARHENDPLRSWTMRLQNNSRMIINGAGIINTFSLLIISR